jgi:hypothetical protein
MRKADAVIRPSTPASSMLQKKADNVPKPYKLLFLNFLGNVR